MSYLWLDTTVEVDQVGHDLVLWSGSRTLRVDALGALGLAFVRRLDGSELSSALTQMVVGGLLIPLLDREGWLIRLERPLEEVIADRPWLSRQLAYLAQIAPRGPDKAFEELARRHVLIIGVGGVGSHVAYILAGSNVGRLTLVDPDVVEASNLNRQLLFTQEHIGLEKAGAAAEEIRKRFPGARITPVHAPFSLAHLDEAPDLILICAGTDLPFVAPDRFGSQTLLLAGYAGAKAVVGPLIDPREKHCWTCLVQERETAPTANLPRTGLPRATAWNTSGATINALVASLTAETALRHLAPSLGGDLLGPYERLVVDMRDLQAQREQLLNHPCPHNAPLPESAGAQV